jgi:hypothetical protein
MARKRGGMEKRQLIKITVANICTANVSGSNIITRKPLRLEDISGRRNIW